MFGFHGVWQGTSILYDRQTHSHWLHLTGECIEGPHQGSDLKSIPGRHVLWREWKRDHPDSEVMMPDPQLAEKYFAKEASVRGVDHFPPQFQVTIDNPDDRLQPSELVYGVQSPTAARAYPFTALARVPDGLVNDQVGSTPVVIFFDRTTGSAAGHGRQVGDQTLEFDRTAEGLLQDRASGSIFNRDGKCVEGPLLGRHLPPLFALQAEWYGWSAAYPQTTVFESP